MRGEISLARRLSVQRCTFASMMPSLPDPDFESIPPRKTKLTTFKATVLGRGNVIAASYHPDTIVHAVVREPNAKVNALEVCARVIMLEQRDRLIDRLGPVAAIASTRTEPWWRWTAWLAIGITVGRIERATYPFGSAR